MAEEGSSSDRGWLERLGMALTGEPSSRSELIETLRAAEQRQLLDAEALSIIEGALVVAEMQAREIIIPRSQVAVVRMDCLLYTSPSPRDRTRSRMPSSA